jgi:hypothetical protein
MMMRRWLLAGALVAAGCASTFGTKVSDRDVARLPAQDQEKVIAASNQIPKASANVETARLQLDEARQFRRVAQNEVDAARSRLEAGRNAIVLAHSTRDPHQLRAAQRNEDLARDELIAARAKLDYADRLVALRDAKLDEANQQLRLARAETESRKAELIVKNGIASDINLAKIQRERDDTQTRLAEIRTRVAVLGGEVQQLRVAWNDRRRELNTASRDMSVLPLPPPRPREMLPVDPPRGDVNDTPAAPETPQGQPGEAPPIAPSP